MPLQRAQIAGLVGDALRATVEAGSRPWQLGASEEGQNPMYVICCMKYMFFILYSIY